MNGVGKKLGLQFVHDFCGFEVNEKSKADFRNLVTLCEKLELDMKEDNFTELLAVQHKKLTNEGLMELEAQRKNKKKQEWNSFLYRGLTVCLFCMSS